MSRAFTFPAAVAVCVFLFVPSTARAADELLARIAVVSNPYITTLPAAEINVTIRDGCNRIRDCRLCSRLRLAVALMN